MSRYRPFTTLGRARAGGMEGTRFLDEPDPGGATTRSRFICRARLDSSFASGLQYDSVDPESLLYTEVEASSLWWTGFCVLEDRLKKSAPPGIELVPAFGNVTYLVCGGTSSCPPSFAIHLSLIHI